MSDTDENLDHQARAMGTLFCAFQTLESLIRHYLNEIDSAFEPAHEPLALARLAPGQDAALGPLTNDDRLATLIRKYNARALASDLCIDPAVATIRNALMFGRNVLKPGQPMTLVRFKPSRKNDVVTVAWSAEITRDWLAAENRRLRSAIAIVEAALEAISHQGM